MIKVSVLVSLYRCNIFLESFLQEAVKCDNKEYLEFLLLHNDPLPEETEIINKYLSSFPNIDHVKIPQREGLYQTWNRGIKLAKGDYVAVWNVDDIRTPGSLSYQTKALDDNADAIIAYGDFYLTAEYKGKPKYLDQYQNWSKSDPDFIYRHMIGCFPMWRKSVHEAAGYFDENFRLIADYDFQIRVHLSYSMVKAEGILGYYLVDQPHKLSSSRETQALESTCLKLRYNMFKILDFSLIMKARKKYNIRNIINFGVANPVESLIPDYKAKISGNNKHIINMLGYTSINASKRIVKDILFKTGLRKKK